MARARPDTTLVDQRPALPSAPPEPGPQKACVVDGAPRRSPAQHLWPLTALAILAIIAALLLATGCSRGSEEPLETGAGSPAATSTTSPSSPSTTESARPPVLPAAARRPGRSGAIAFTKHYIALLNYAQATGDTAALKAASAPGCKSCTRISRIIDEAYSAGGSIRSAGWVALQVNPAVGPSGLASRLVSVRLKVGKQAFVGSDGTVEKTVGRDGENELTFQLSFQDRFTVVEIRATT